MHVKGAPQVECRRRRGGTVWGGVCPLPENCCISYIKMVSFYALLVIFIDTFENVIFKKAPYRAGVRTPWTPSGSAPVHVHNADECVVLETE